MSNKTQLQTNNTNLQTVLSNVLGLPTEESCKNGAYVWKKCKSKSPIGIASLSASGTSTVITLESSEGVTEETLDGAVFTATMIDGTYSCTFTLSYANGSKTFSSTDVYGGNYSYSNGVITLNTTFAFTSSQFNASNITFPDVEPEFIDFVVSDNESAYPDGGTQDGYWYERVVEGVDLMTMLGCTKMTINKITFATEQYDGTQIPHSHGYAPKYIIMTTSSIPDTPYTVKDAFFVNDKRIGAWYTTGSDGQVYPQDSRTTGVIVNDSYFKIGTTTSKPSHSSYLRYGIGIEYNIICFS